MMWNQSHKARQKELERTKMLFDVNRILSVIKIEHQSELPLCKKLIQKNENLAVLLNIMHQLSKNQDRSNKSLGLNTAVRAELIAVTKIRALELTCLHYQQASEMDPNYQKQIDELLKLLQAPNAYEKPIYTLVSLSNKMEQLLKLNTYESYWHTFVKTLFYIISFGLFNPFSELDQAVENMGQLKAILNGKEAGLECDGSKLHVEKTLYIHSSGGNGHTAAMQGLRSIDIGNDIRRIESEIGTTLDDDEAMIQHIQSKGLQLNLLEDLVPVVGTMGAQKWNKLQQNRDEKGLQRLIDLEPITQLIFSPIIYSRLYSYLIAHPEIETIVDTQPLCTGALCQAIRDVNAEFGRQITLHKHMTDLPTSEAEHFFSSLRQLSPKDIEILRLHTYEPLIPHNVAGIVDQESFFKHYLGQNFSIQTAKNPKGTIIIEEDFPVRYAFRSHALKKAFAVDDFANIALGDKNRQIQKLSFDIHSNFELNYFEKIYDNYNDELDIDSAGLPYIKNPSKLDMTLNDEKVTLAIKPDDIVASIMLGSQGSTDIIDLVKIIIDATSHIELDKRIIIPVYCGSTRIKDSKGNIERRESNALLRDLVSTIEKASLAGLINDKLHILPVGDQNDKVIADNYCRDDILIGASGGLSTMEYLATAKVNKDGHFITFSNSEGNDYWKMMKGIFIGWERGNASYLQHFLGNRATVQNKETFAAFFKDYLARNAKTGRNEIKNAQPPITEANLTLHKAIAQNKRDDDKNAQLLLTIEKQEAKPSKITGVKNRKELALSIDEEIQNLFDDNSTDKPTTVHDEIDEHLKVMIGYQRHQVTSTQPQPINPTENTHSVATRYSFMSPIKKSNIELENDLASTSATLVH